jgi:hypothetical protein
LILNPIDTLKRRKPYCTRPDILKKIGAPVEVVDIVAEETFNHYIKTGTCTILLEGSFHSMFENRVLPFEQQRLVCWAK